MYEVFIVGDNLTDVYHRSLLALKRNGEITECPDWNCKQKEVTMTMVISHPLHEPMISKCFIGGWRELEQYRMEMLDGILDFEVERGNWTYTYHQRIASQLPWVIEELKRNPESRRACIMVRSKADIGSDDPACFCSGTKIFTPNGYVNVEEISNDDVVYTYDMKQHNYVETKVHDCFEMEADCLEISTFFGNIRVSKDQLLYTNDGWKKACELAENDFVLYSDIQYDENSTLWHLIGCIIGDGWISTPVVRRKNIRRKDIGMSVNFKSIDINVEKMLKSFSNNTVSSREYAVDSKIVSGGHVSKKYEISDCALHNTLMNYIPYGRKTSGNMLFNADDLSLEQTVDFLTGVFSSEGCVTHRGKNNSHYIPFIEIGMVWKECIDVISKMLDKLSIQHKMYESKSSHKIRICGLDPLLKFIDSGIDFRFDSRKQIRFLNLKYVCYKTKEAGEKYGENTKWQDVDLEMLDNALFVKVDKINSIGKHTVYDFTVDNENHNIIADNFIAHNCLQHIQFLIRKNKLDMKVLFRSNDACKAAFMNMFALICLQQKVAKELGLGVGHYTHRANSYHCYEKDFDLLEGYCKRIEDNKGYGVTYRYKGEWDEMMEESREEILEEVEKLKEYGRCDQ